MVDLGPNIASGCDVKKSALVKAIYAEIRRSQPAIPAGEALDAAYRLLQLFRADPDLMRRFGREVDARSISDLPVDEAMRDGGWRIMEYEIRRAGDLEQLEHETLAALRGVIERYLGPEWQHHSQVRPL